MMASLDGSAEGDNNVTAEENKALVRRFVEAQVKADLDTLDELLAPDFVDHSLEPGQDAGREGYMRALAEEIFSNQRTIIEDQAGSRSPLTGLHGRGTWEAQRSVERSHPPKHVRHLLLCHPRSRER